MHVSRVLKDSLRSRRKEFFEPVMQFPRPRQSNVGDCVTEHSIRILRKTLFSTLSGLEDDCRPGARADVLVPYENDDAVIRDREADPQLAPDLMCGGACPGRTVEPIDGPASRSAKKQEILAVRVRQNNPCVFVHPGGNRRCRPFEGRPRRDTPGHRRRTAPPTPTAQ